MTIVREELCPYILFGAGLVSRFMKTLTMTHLKALKRILWYIKGTINFGLFYDWAGDLDDRKSITSFVFYIGDITFTWSSNKQFIVTLSIYEAEYVAATSCVCHSIWLRRILKELRILHEKPT
jgi:hypothetical protein